MKNSELIKEAGEAFKNKNSTRARRFLIRLKNRFDIDTDELSFTLQIKLYNFADSCIIFNETDNAYDEALDNYVDSGDVRSASNLAIAAKNLKTEQREENRRKNTRKENFENWLNSTNDEFKFFEDDELNIKIFVQEKDQTALYHELSLTQALEEEKEFEPELTKKEFIKRDGFLYQITRFYANFSLCEESGEIDSIVGAPAVNNFSFFKNESKKLIKKWLSQTGDLSLQDRSDIRDFYQTNFNS